jgi:hypothetical protein
MITSSSNIGIKKSSNDELERELNIPNPNA